VQGETVDNEGVSKKRGGGSRRRDHAGSKGGGPFRRKKIIHVGGEDPHAIEREELAKGDHLGQSNKKRLGG